MDLDLFLAKIHRKLMRWNAHRSPRRLITRLEAQNITSHCQVVAPGGPVVSLTSYGQRVSTVFLAIESIARGSLLPSRLILWIDEAPVLSDLPDSLRRLQDRGLEILPTENYGPHKKYYPYVQSTIEHALPLVTADDDVLYPRYWLARLFKAYQRMPDAVACFRASVLRCKAGVIAPYLSWSPCESRVASPCHFGTGMSGIIYPPALLEHLRGRADEFMAKAPRADDVWLHATAVRHGFPTRQVVRFPRDFPTLPGTQEVGLFHANAYAGGNDPQIAASYGPADVAKICEANT